MERPAYASPFSLDARLSGIDALPLSPEARELARLLALANAGRIDLGEHAGPTVRVLSAACDRARVPRRRVEPLVWSLPLLPLSEVIHDTFDLMRVG